MYLFVVHLILSYHMALFMRFPTPALPLILLLHWASIVLQIAYFKTYREVGNKIVTSQFTFFQ